MKNIINSIEQMINNGVVLKSDFLPLVVKLEKEIIDFIDKQNFVYTETPNIFYRTTDERLSDIKEKQKIAESKPEIVVQENIKDILNCLSNFKEKYNIGFIQKATVGSNGFVKVVMPCMINSSFVNDNKVSAKQTFDAQIEFLKENGFELISKKNYGIKLKKSENNFNILDTILTQRGATQIKYSITDDFIDEIEFYVNISNVHKFNEEPIKIELPISKSELNQDEILKVKKNLNEILFAQDTILTMEGDIKNTCCSLIQSYFAEISKMLNYDGEIAKTVKERYGEERDKNLMINDIESKVGKILSSEQIVNTLNVCKRKLDEFVVTHFSFYVSEFSIDKYGFVDVKLRYIPSKYCLTEFHKLPSQKYMRENFDMTSGNRESETFFVLDSTENKSRIFERLKEFCSSSRITNLSVTNRDNSFVINTIELVIDNIANIC
jgi:hypothetical protein